MAAYGLTLAVYAGFGGATLAIFWQGVANLTGLTIGGASLAVAVVMLAFVFFYDRRQIHIGTVIYQLFCNGVQREHNKKLNNGLPILHKVPPKRDYGRYFCIMAEKGGTSHGGLTEKLSPFFHAKKQEVNAYGR